MNRIELADELMSGIGKNDADYKDTKIVADDVRGGVDAEKILNYEELNNWPETAIWLRNQFVSMGEINE